jgi:hypothetical protein
MLTAQEIQAVAESVEALARRVAEMMFKEEGYIRGRLHSISNMLMSISAELGCIASQKEDPGVMC